MEKHNKFKTWASSDGGGAQLSPGDKAVAWACVAVLGLLAGAWGYSAGEWIYNLINGIAQ